MCGVRDPLSGWGAPGAEAHFWWACRGGPRFGVCFPACGRGWREGRREAAAGEAGGHRAAALGQHRSVAGKSTARPAHGRAAAARAETLSRGCRSSRGAGVVPRDERDWCTGGRLTEKCSHLCLLWGWCRNAASPSGAQGAADVVGGLGKCRRARNVRGSEWLRLQRAGVRAGSPSPPAAPGGSTSWMAQPGFPWALVPFQLPLLWQPIPLLSGCLAWG